MSSARGVTRGRRAVPERKGLTALAEGLSVNEVGKEIAEHEKRAHESEEHTTEREQSRKTTQTLTVVEAVLLAVVAILAAWSGYASAKWGTESALSLAKASAARTEANREAFLSMETRNFDSSTFNTWVTAYLTGNKSAMAIAQRGFRDQFNVAFEAWMATDPFSNPNAPKGPTYMPQYSTPGQAESVALDAKADAEYAAGAKAAATSDAYVRTTVYLASVLFLVGISGHFAVRRARIGLVAIGSAILVISIVLLATSPIPTL
jgi:hypothetical protein